MMRKYWKIMGLDPRRKKLEPFGKIRTGAQAVTWRTWAGRISVFALSAAAVSFILLFTTQTDLSKVNFRIGEPAQRTLFSPIDVEFINPMKTESVKSERRDKVPPVYRLDRTLDQQMTEQVDQLFASAQQSQNGEVKEGARLLQEDFPFEISSNVLKFLNTSKELEDIRKYLQMLFEQTASKGILSYRARMDLLRSGDESITVIHPEDKTEVLVPVEDVFVLNELHESVPNMLPESVTRKRNVRNAVFEIYRSVSQANLVYDEAETERRRVAASEGVEPVKQFIKEDQLIIQRGMLVTPDVKLAIDEIHGKQIKRQQLKRIASVGLLAFLTYGLLFCFLFFFERRRILSLRDCLLIHTVFITSILICKVIGEWPGTSPYFMPSALASLLIVLLLNARLGAAAAFVSAILIAPIADFQPDVFMGALLSGLTASFAARTVRKRIQFMKVGFIIGSVYTAVFFVIQLFQETPAVEALQISALGGYLNGLLITMPLLFLLLPLFEHFFDLATDITLLELSDLNHPLLKRMIIEAPGTYHHSLVVSRLSETACEEIGANPLLARVGCYFHDIGKIARSEYFGENQTGRFGQKHEKLTPTMSSLLIISHVKDGIELGRKHKLKESVLRFIPEHQGTGVVYYFYRKALDSAAPGEQVNMNDFRYPGPNPQSKETAVAMLADCVEAASRSIKEPSPEELRVMVRKIINDKFIDGQLNECDLTLRDLHLIQESFVRNLMGIYHTRVSYPEKPANAQNPDLFQEKQTQEVSRRP